MTRWGVLGAARINQHVLEGAALAEGTSFVAIAARDRDRAQEQADTFDIGTVYGSYDELLADPGVEAVYIPLPNGLHVEWSVRALEAGKHVLCEKPLARTEAEARRAFATARSAERLLMEAFMWRHLPQTQVACDLVAQGAVGELRMIRVWFGFLLSRSGDPRLDPAQQGGALMDVGCYCVSAARLLAGEPDAVAAQAVRDAGRADGVDVRVAATMRFPGHVLAHFDCALDLPQGHGLQVVGSEAALEIDDPWFGREPGIRVRAADGTVEEIEADAADPYRAQLEDLAGAIADGRGPLLDRAEVVGQARSLQALLRAMSNDEEDVR